MQSKVLKRPLEELESPLDPPNHELIQDSTGERPAKRCAPSSNNNVDQNGVTTKFSVEIVQQLEFSASNGSAQSQQIQTNVTVKTLAGSVKSETGNPNLDNSQPVKEELNSNNCVNNSNIPHCQQGSMVEFKQEPEGDNSEFPDNLSGLIVEDDLINSDTFKDIMSGIDLSADIDFDIESACASDSTFSVKQEDPPNNVFNGVDNSVVNNGVTSTAASVGNSVSQTFSQSVPTSQSYYSNQGIAQFSQTNYSTQNTIVNSQTPPVASPPGQVPVSSQLPVTRAAQPGQGRGPYVGSNMQTGLDAAQTLKQMAEQHQQQRQLVMMPGPGPRPQPQQTTSTSYNDYSFSNQDMISNSNNYMNKMTSPPTNQSTPMYNNYVNTPTQIRPQTPDELRKRSMMTPVTMPSQTTGQIPPNMTRSMPRTNQMPMNQYNEVQMRSKMSPLAQQRQAQVMNPGSMMSQSGHQIQNNKPMNVTPQSRTSGYYNPMQNMTGSPGMQINVSQSQSISLQVNGGGNNMPHQHMMHSQPQNNGAMMGYSMAPRPPPPEYKQTHMGMQQDAMMTGNMMSTHQTKGFPRPSMQQTGVPPHQMRMTNSNHSQSMPLGSQTLPSMQSRPNYGPSVMPGSRPTGMNPGPQTMNVNQPMNTSQQQANWRQMMMSQQQTQNMRFNSSNNAMMNQYQSQTNTQVYNMANSQQAQMQTMQQQSVAMRMRSNNPSSQSVHPSNNVPPMHSYMGGMVNQNQVVMPMQHPSGPGRGAGPNPSHNQMQVNMQVSQSANMSVGSMHQSSYIPQQQGQTPHVNDFNLEFLDQLDGGTPNFTCSDAQDLLNTFDSIVQNNMLDGL